MPTGQLVAQHGSDRAIHVSYRGGDVDRRSLFQGHSGLGDQVSVQDVLQAMVLTTGVAAIRITYVGHVEDGR